MAGFKPHRPQLPRISVQMLHIPTLQLPYTTGNFLSHLPYLLLAIHFRYQQQPYHTQELPPRILMHSLIQTEMVNFIPLTRQPD